MRHAGIDPGLDGGIAVIEEDGAVRSWRVPTLVIEKGGKSKTVYDPGGMLKIVLELKEAGPVCVVLEQQQAFPAQGSVSCYSIGLGFGLWQGILVGAGISYNIVRAQAWQKVMGLGVRGRAAQERKARKNEAYLVACRLFPEAEAQLRTPRGKVLTGIVDALLMAEFGKRSG